MITPELLIDLGACWPGSKIKQWFKDTGEDSVSPRRILEDSSIPSMDRIWVGLRVLLIRKPAERQVLLRECVRRLAERVGAPVEFFEILARDLILPRDVREARTRCYVSIMDEPVDQAWLHLWDLALGSGYTVITGCLNEILSDVELDAEIAWILRSMLELLGPDAEGWS